MYKLIAKAATFTIILGIVGIALNYIFGYETMVFIQKEQITMFNGQHFYIWKLNMWKYLKNLELAITNTNQLSFTLPTRVFNSDIANNMALIMDYLILIINILLYPLRIGAYLINNIMAVLGINRDLNAQYNGLKWLYQLIDNMISLAIPYI